MGKWKSRKLLVTVGAMLTVVLTNVVGLTPDQASNVTNALTIIAGLFLGAQGVADTASNLKHDPEK